MIETIKNKYGTSFRARIYGLDRKPVSQTFQRKEDAKAWERRKLYERDQAKISGIELKDGTPFEAFSKIWFETKVAPKLSNSTKRCYSGDIKNHILPTLTNVNMRNISERHAHQIVATMKARGNAPKTINSVIALLNGMLIDGVKWNFLAKNPMIGFPKLKKAAQPDAFWTPSEVSQFLRANLRNPLYTFFLVALNTGMRKGEIAGLKWDRIRISERSAIIEVTRTLSKYGLEERTKTHLKRCIPVNDVVKDALLKLRMAQRTDFVFTDDRGKPLDVNHVYRAFRAAQERAGMTNLIRFHDLRHTFASNFIMNGGSLYDLQKLLGHTSIKMTERYTHLAPDHLEKTVGIVSFG